MQVRVGSNAPREGSLDNKHSIAVAFEQEGGSEPAITVMRRGFQVRSDTQGPFSGGHRRQSPGRHRVSRALGI